MASALFAVRTDGSCRYAQSAALWMTVADALRRRAGGPGAGVGHDPRAGRRWGSSDRQSDQRAQHRRDALLGAAYVPSGLAGRDLAAPERRRRPPGARGPGAAGRAGGARAAAAPGGGGAARSAGSALTQTVLFYGATFWGIAHAGAGLSAVLANTDPLFVAVLAGLVLGERLGAPPVARAWRSGLVGAALRGLAGAAVAARALGAGAGGGGRRLRLERRHGGRGPRHAPRARRPAALAGWQMAAGRCRARGGRRARPTRARRRSARARRPWSLALAVVGSAAPLALFYMALMRAPPRRCRPGSS